MQQPDDTEPTYTAAGYKTSGNFSVYDVAKCLRHNTLSQGSGFKCEQLVKQPPFTSRDTHDTIYAAVATAYGLQVDDFELWYGSTACPVYIFEKGAHLARWMDYYTFFVRRIKGTPETHLISQVTIYLKFFCPQWEQQLQYIGDATLSSSKTVMDVIEIVNQRLGIPAGTVLDVFEESLNKTAKKLAYKITSTLLSAYLSNGALLIFQVAPGEEVPSLTFTPKPARRASAAVPAEPEEAPAPDQPLFNIVDQSAAAQTTPTTVEEYFARSVTTSVDITLFDYSAPTVALAVLRCPLSTSIDALAKFVIRVARVQCDETADTLLLYKKDHDDDGPSKTPLRPDWYPTIQYDFDTVAAKGKRLLFFRLLTGISPAEYEAGTIQTVTFADENRAVIRTQEVCLPKSATMESVQPKLDEINFFGGDTRETKGAVVGEYACTLIDPLATLWYSRKIVYVVVERLVHDLGENERLLLVSEGILGSSDYLVPVGVPGFIKVGPDVTLAVARPALGQLFGLSEDKLKKAKFFPCVSWARYAANEALKDTFCLGDLRTDETLFVVSEFKRKSGKARAAEESIHISN
jgi:hypothetical protein